jgi:hypothetical protein
MDCFAPCFAICPRGEHLVSMMPFLFCFHFILLAKVGLLVLLFQVSQVQVY